MEDVHPNYSGRGFFKRLSSGFARLVGVSNDSEKVEEEIKQMVSEGHERGVLEADEAKMINNIFEFSDKEASDIMTHRHHVVGLRADLSVVEAAKRIISESYSRFPVYEEDIDNIVGILHVKDIMKALVEHDDDVKLSQIMRPPYFVPETQNIDNLFKEMQQKKMHMAIVVDEYGQTAGVVAMEDILEEIVGNIFDEYDLEESFIVKKGQDTYMLKGYAPLEEVEETLGIDFCEEDFDTINGLLIARLEHIPAEDEKVSIDIAGYRFSVLSVKNNMISEIRAQKLDDRDDSGLESDKD